LNFRCCRRHGSHGSYAIVGSFVFLLGVGKGIAVRVVCVHGIGQQRLGELELLKEWVPALQDGLTRAGAAGWVDDGAIGMGFYGDLFRPPGERLDAGDPPLTAKDVEEGLESELLMGWWSEAARVDPAVVPPDAAGTLARTPGSVQAGLRALSRSKFFSGVALRAMVADLRQVRRYLTEPKLRNEMRARVSALIGPDTEVVVGHSLGSVVAYEVLCSDVDTQSVRALVTLGSPLGIANTVFDRLEPAPANGKGRWPGGRNLSWTNVADAGDVVALVKDLRPKFGPELAAFMVDNGAHAHDVKPYLSDAVTGAAIAAALEGP
jgi:hypothetical protein